MIEVEPVSISELVDADTSQKRQSLAPDGFLFYRNLEPSLDSGSPPLDEELARLSRLFGSENISVSELAFSQLGEPIKNALAIYLMETAKPLNIKDRLARKIGQLSHRER
jgi:hypothetical protein